MKKILIIAITLIVLGAGVGAYAYAAETNNSNSNNTINQTSTNIGSGNTSTTQNNNNTENTGSNNKSGGNSNGESNSNTNENSQANSNNGEAESNSNNNDKLANLKSYYLNKLENVQANLKKANANMSDVQYEETFIDNYNTWHNTLNSIIQSIKENTSPQQFSEIQEDENNWLKNMTITHNNIFNQGGSMSAMSADEYLSSATKKRCYYMVNKYL